LTDMHSKHLEAITEASRLRKELEDLREAKAKADAAAAKQKLLAERALLTKTDEVNELRRKCRHLQAKNDEISARKIGAQFRIRDYFSEAGTYAGL
jgi:hypothetical protein